MIQNKTNNKVINIKEKRKLAEKGKKLIPLKVQIAAIEKFGIKNYIKKLAEHFEVTDQTIRNAFNGNANAKLLEIKNYLKSINVSSLKR